MIIREIIDNPLGELARFDYFNDYDDTRRWLSHDGPADVLALLDSAHAVWLRLSLQLQRQSGKTGLRTAMMIKS